MDEVETIILTSIETHVQVRPKLSDEMLLLGVDSLALAETTHQIEQELKVRLDDRLLDQKTVGELINYVRE